MKALCLMSFVTSLWQKNKTGSPYTNVQPDTQMMFL